MTEMTGAKALITSLEKEGVDVIFGLPGGANLPIYDALVDADFRHILVRHEQSAAHMADGYARVKRKAGVCFATSGPGADESYHGNRNSLCRLFPNDRGHGPSSLRNDWKRRLPRN